MPVDVSSYPTAATMAAQQQANNPLVMLSTLQDLRGKGLQNQLVSRTMGAQQALGEDAQAAIGDDGTFDPAKYQTIIKGDPRAAYGVPQAIADAQARQQELLNQAHQQFGVINSAVSSLLVGATGADGHIDPSKISGDDVKATVGDLVEQGVITPQRGATEMKAMPDDPQSRVHWLQEHLANTLDGQSKVAAMFGTPTPVNTGGQTQFVRTPALGETPAPLTNTPTPESMNQPVTTFDNNTHQFVSQPMSSYLASTKNGPVAAGPAQGTDQSANVNAQANAQRYQQTLEAANAAHTTKALLGNMKGDLTAFQTGPGAESWKQMAAKANYWEPGTFDTDAVASQENFTKAARILANHTMEAGGGTDMAKAFSMAQNPNTEVSTEGNRRIIAGLQGQADRDILKGELATDYARQHPNDPNAYSDFETKFNRSFDMRMFQAQYLTPKALAEMKAGMTAAEWNSFKSRYQDAITKGYVRAPGQ